MYSFENVFETRFLGNPPNRSGLVFGTVPIPITIGNMRGNVMAKPQKGSERVETRILLTLIMM